jgi:N-acetylglucosamine kinase-like BadF-type ATPase
VAYYLGIDGGGSKTTCQVGTDDSILSTVTAGPSNITRVGEARAREALHQAIQRACEGASIHPRQLRRACIGAAGAGREDIAASVRKIAAEIIPGEIEVVGDMQIALEAAFGAGPGVIVIAGTGSIAYGRDAQGRTARAGGWGFAISDEGSAHWIGRAAVGAALRSIDEEVVSDMIVGEKIVVDKSEQESQQFPLLRNLQSAWKLNTLSEFVNKANSSPDYAALFPVIVSTAEAGDVLAHNVLSQAGRELARIAELVVRKLFGTETQSDVPLAMVGGVFRHSAQVRKIFCDQLRGKYPCVRINPQVVEPVAGALQMARSHAATGK